MLGQRRRRLVSIDPALAAIPCGTECQTVIILFFFSAPWLHENSIPLVRTVALANHKDGWADYLNLNEWMNK